MSILEKIILELLKSRVKTRADLDSFKRKVAKEYKTPCPTNVELLKTYHKLVKKKRLKKDGVIEKLLCTRPIRSLSGIVNVSVLTKPYPCPGQCIFCPSQKGIPKSYLRGEPAVQRAILNKFNPYSQVQTRLKSLQKTGHPIDKIELRIIGGTWSYYPKQYQTRFVKECFQACNEFSPLKQIRHKKAMAELRRIKEKELEKELKKEQKANEKAKCRVVGITIETRPDYIDIKEIKRMRELGITRVELGVQSIYNDVLKLNKRGHGIEATIKATKLLKESGFKVSYQMMPNLPGSTSKKDVKMFEEIFENPDFQPDLLKIYPLALLKEAPLYKWYQRGKFKPYSDKKLIKLLIEIKKKIPYWCRIQRVIRDIPSADIVEGGVKISNLREVVQKEMKKQGLKCKCIRCREVKKDYNSQEKSVLFRQDYNASGGKEVFLTFEDKKRQKLYALLRLRIPYPKVAKDSPLPILKDAAIIREVHTYGQLLPIQHRDRTKIGQSPQHKGLGKKLIKQGEEIAKQEFGTKKIAVISGVGVRAYYRKLGYHLKDTYMIKKL